MSGVDPSLTFYPLAIAVLTISDTRDATNDRAGDFLVERLTSAGHRLEARAWVPDQVEPIRRQVEAWTSSGGIEVVLTTGGTGFGPCDVTPEALRPMFRREMDGFSVLMHQAGAQSVGVATMQSRACAGQVGDAFVFCLPGSTGGCRDAWEVILAMELDSRFRPCSLAGLLPRLRGTCA